MESASSTAPASTFPRYSSAPMSDARMSSAPSANSASGRSSSTGPPAALGRCPPRSLWPVATSAAKSGRTVETPMATPHRLACPVVTSRTSAGAGSGLLRYERIVLTNSSGWSEIEQAIGEAAAAIRSGDARTTTIADLAAELSQVTPRNRSVQSCGPRRRGDIGETHSSKV